MRCKPACDAAFGLLITSCIWISCKHDQDYNPGDTSKPVLTITAPVQNRSYKSGDSIKITGTLTDNSLHELQLKIVQNSNNVVLFYDIISVHDLSSYMINDGWKSSV